MLRFIILGGDKRQLYAAQYLMQQGYSVSTAEDCPEFEEKIADADCVILPLPVSRDGVRINAPLSVVPLSLKRVIRSLNKGQAVFAGMPDCELAEKLRCKGVKLYDYYENEALAILNSISTAEGVIYEAIGSLPTDIHGSKVAVFGYGKAGSAIARRFCALGAQVTAFVRSETAAASAAADGCKAVMLHSKLRHNTVFDIVVNTVPAPVIDEAFIKTLPRASLIIEVASAPYGVDFKAAEKNEIRVLRAPSLPGRFSPKSAGEAIAKTIINAVTNLTGEEDED